MLDSSSDNLMKTDITCEMNTEFWLVNLGIDGRILKCRGHAVA
jgi:hypothetical protein